MAERKHYTAEFKTRVVLELLTAQKGLMQASRDYGIKDTILSRWKQEFLERAPQLFKGEKTEDHQAEMRIAELERMVGKLTLELDTAKKSWATPTGSERQAENSPDVASGTICSPWNGLPCAGFATE